MRLLKWLGLLASSALFAAPGGSGAGGPAGGTLAYVRLYTGSDGLTHFSDERLALEAVPGGQGMEASLAVNRLGDAKGVLFAQLKAGATEDWHVAPRRQLMVCVRGVVEITAGDGQKRRLEPGQFMLLEDTSGKGHITHATGTEDHVALAIPLTGGIR
jgi:quercetin dioxygenase-like cupin family protein